MKPRETINNKLPSKKKKENSDYLKQYKRPETKQDEHFSSILRDYLSS